MKLRPIIRFLCLGLILFVTTLAGFSQTVPVGTLFVTEWGPEGAILAPLDMGPSLDLSLFRRVVPVQYSDSVTCAKNERLLITSHFIERFASDNVNQILRIDRDGSGGRLVVAEWAVDFMRPVGLFASPEDDLFFGSVSTEIGVPSRGIWRIRGAAGSENEFETPEQLLDESHFTHIEGGGFGAAAFPIGFLSTGPFAGDLLLVDSPNAFADSSPNASTSRILRAVAPDFTSTEVFIEADFVNPSTGTPESLFAGVVDRNGDVLIGSRFDKILKFSSDGTFLNVFVETPNPNFMAVGSDNLIYASNGSVLGNAAQRRLNIFDSSGGIFKSLITPFEVVGIAVCE